MLKKFLIGLMVLVAVLAGVSYLFPRYVSVTHTARLASPPEVIYPLVATPREWPQWSPWNQRDPDMTISYSGPASGSGARWEWKSAQEGDGAMVLIEATPPSTVGYELTIVGMGPPSYGDLQITASGTGSQVSWNMTLDMGNTPIGRWLGLYMPTMLRKDFVEGLEGLDRYAQSKQSATPTP